MTQSVQCFTSPEKLSKRALVIFYHRQYITQWYHIMQHCSNACVKYLYVSDTYRAIVTYVTQWKYDDTVALHYLSHSDVMCILWRCNAHHTVASHACSTTADLSHRDITCTRCQCNMCVTISNVHTEPLQYVWHHNIMCIQSHCNTCHTVTSDAYVTHRHDTCIQHHCNVCHTNIACMQHYSKPCVTQRYHMLQCHCHKVILHAYSAREICIT